MSRAIVVAAAFVAVATITPHAQTAPQSTFSIVKRDRVDLSGHWENVNPAGFGALGKEFTAAQDATSLTVEMATVNYTFDTRQGGSSVATPGPMRRMVYQFNGVETREAFAMPEKFATLDPSHAYFGYTSSTSTRAAWQGDQLVVVTHNTIRDHRPRHTPADFDSEQTTRLALSLDSDGTLIAERIIIADPDSDSALRTNLPGVMKTVYRKAGLVRQ